MSNSPWMSETQLVRFRATSVQVADEYLKKHNIKLRWKDSEKIDFRRRMLE
ncbi:hypothetical protein BDV37DRAFT_290046 [Aspergillus pseudonomiae]|uniref:Uncharacterized protein n=1 Tax=Aspergillus pseudonomiae TaxID=1506151 RepID=A0A5N7CRC1_9EURO|nr:uncharacterized protein BDV37DRAFT_290046 [Aspergillus pseudonomiae]KAE8396746.1 hypothetical protein BDV37DRAFT_290046 [Aspergillus pseudonomiae]